MRDYTELQARIITAFISALLALPCLFILPNEFFYAFISLVFGICAWEWANLAGLSSFRSVLYGVSLAGLIVVFMLLRIPSFWIISAGLVWWTFALYSIIVYPKLGSFWSRSLPVLFVGIIVLVPSFFSFVALKNHQNSNALIFILLVFVWGSDIGAFFIGKAMGGAKLCAHVSPAKTWSGFLGGALIVAVSSVLIFRMFDEILSLGGSVYFFLLLALFLAGISVLGDLTVSMFKRARRIKDTGRLLPGHGGFLDRLDSLLSTSSAFAMVVTLDHFYVSAV